MRHVATAVVAFVLLSSVAGADHDPAASRLLELANAARAAERLAPLQWDARLEEVARANTARMVHARRLRHTDVHTLRRLPVAAAAENVGAASDADTLHGLLLASRRHRASVLGPYDLVGIASGRGRDGRLYATFVFAATRRR